MASKVITLACAAVGVCATGYKAYRLYQLYKLQKALVSRPRKRHLETCDQQDVHTRKIARVDKLVIEIADGSYSQSEIQATRVQGRRRFKRLPPKRRQSLLVNTPHTGVPQLPMPHPRILDAHLRRLATNSVVELVSPAEDDGKGLYKGNRLQYWNYRPTIYMLALDLKLHTGPGIRIIPELKFQGEASDLREDLDFIWVALTSMMTLAEVGRSNLKALRLQEIPGGLSMRVDIELDPTDLMYHARQFRDTLKGFPENVFPEAYLEKYGVPEVEVVFPQLKKKKKKNHKLWAGRLALMVGVGVFALTTKLFN